MAVEDPMDEVAKQVGVGAWQVLSFLLNRVGRGVGLMHATTYQTKKMEVREEILYVTELRMAVMLPSAEKVVEVAVLIDPKVWPKYLELPLPPEQAEPGKPHPTYGTQERFLLAELRGWVQEVILNLREKESPEAKEAVEELERAIAGSKCPVPDKSLVDSAREALKAMPEKERIDTLQDLYAEFWPDKKV